MTPYLLIGSIRSRPHTLRNSMAISAIGWIHTLGSLPAIPLAGYMLARHGRIVPGTRAGTAYFWCMLLGALTVYPVAHQRVSLVVATVTLAVLLLGYGLSHASLAGRRLTSYAATIALSLSVFLLMVPAVSETLRRLPAGDPLVTDMKDPLLLGAQGALLLMLVVGVPLQIRALRRHEAASRRA